MRAGRRASRAAGPEALDRLFRALADPTRRHLLTRLTMGPARVTDLARPFRMSLPAVSKHLQFLEEAGLLWRTVDGRVHRLSLRGAPLRRVEAWLDPFRSYWESTFHSLDADLRHHPARGSSRSPPPSPEEGTARAKAYRRPVDRGSLSRQERRHRPCRPRDLRPRR